MCLRVQGMNILILEGVLVSSRSSVEVERGFSIVTLLQSRWRTKLNVSTLENLLMVYLHVPKSSNPESSSELADQVVETFLLVSGFF